MAFGAIAADMASSAVLLIDAGYVLMRHEKIGRVIDRTKVKCIGVAAYAFQGSLLIVMAGGAIFHNRHTFGVGKIHFV